MVGAAGRFDKLNTGSIWWREEPRLDTYLVAVIEVIRSPLATLLVYSVVHQIKAAFSVT